MIPVGRIEQRILLIRGEKVLIDADLAEFYGVATKRLNEQVKRNRRRFPRDFVFRLTAREKAEVVANCDHLAKLKYAKGLPNAFTEHSAPRGGELDFERDESPNHASQEAVQGGPGVIESCFAAEPFCSTPLQAGQAV